MNLSIATWNVNSINARLLTITAWLKEAAPDVVCLQEIKCVDDGFPRLEMESLGYQCHVFGQKSYNGVALLSRFPVSDVSTGLPGDESDEQSRYIEAVIEPENAAPLRVASIYLPNGNPVDGSKYDYKLDWMKRLKAHGEHLLALEEPVVLAGDYNVIPRDSDVHDPAAWRGDALFRPETHAAFRSLLHSGWTEAFEAFDGRGGQYTFWDYQAGAWPKDHGIRIDHFLLSPEAMDRAQGVTIARSVRAMDKPSDHVPVILTLC
jgi:exodeoxyribonuclease III